MEGIGAGSIIRRTENGEHECVTDEVAIEEPLEIRIAGEAVATTMRTPGNDEELAAGFLLSEGIVHTRGELRAISVSAENFVAVELAPTVKFAPAAVQRFGTISSRCGLCGEKSIEFILPRFSAIEFAKESKRTTGSIPFGFP